MKDVFLLSVETMDYDTLETFSESHIFFDEFEPFSINDFRFSFPDEKAREPAIKRLNELKLKFELGFERLFDSTDELKDYAVVTVNFGCEPDLLYEGKVDIELMKNQVILKDFRTNKIFIKKQIKPFFEKNLKAVEYIPTPVLSGKDMVFQLNNLPFLEHPQIILNAQGVQESANPEFSGYSTVKSEGKMLFSHNAIHEVKRKIFVESSKFVFQNRIYPAVSPLLISTGSFAYELQEQFGTENIDVGIPLLATLDEKN